METEVTSTTSRKTSGSTKITAFEKTKINKFSSGSPQGPHKTTAPTTRSPGPSDYRKKPVEVSPHSPTVTPSKSTKSTTTTTTTTKFHESTSKAPAQISDYSDTEDTVETILEKHPQKITKQPITITGGRTKIVTESVAARRNIFEKGSPTKTSPKQGPSSPVPTGRRPSYMDHTKSSLEHTRKDSLEVNKTHYSRKSSFDDDNATTERRPNSAVKFEMPSRQPHTKDTDYDENDDLDINIEEIFDLLVLEELLEKVSSYEMRRRIRAQIRLVKKNMLNVASSVEQVKKKEVKSSATHKSSYMSTSSKVQHEKIDHDARKTKSPTRSPSPPHKLRDDTQSPEGYYYRKPSVRTPTPNYPSEVEHEETIVINETRYRSRSPGSPIVSSTAKEVRRESGSHKQRTRDEHREVDYSSELSESPKPVRKQSPAKRDRSHSPDAKTISSSLKEVRRESATQQTTSKHYSHTEQVDYSSEFPESPRKQSSSKSPERRHSLSPERKPTKSRKESPEGKRPSERSHSPQGKMSVRESSYKMTKTSPNQASKPDDRTPIWADRKNILKNQSNQKISSTKSASKTVKSSTTTSQQRLKNRTMEEEDCITSSYGIGPTDENGLPLFGIRALKKKKPAVVPPSETTEEITGYVVEEKYYSDDKTKPIVERKEYIYSTNEEELEALKKQVSSKKSLKDSDDVDVVRKFEKIDKHQVPKEPAAILSGPDDFPISTKYVRRGSVKEMSEKFIRKESSQSITEKSSSSYPKAGLILRTSRTRSRGSLDGDDCFEPAGKNVTRKVTKETQYSSSRPTHSPSDDQQEHDNDYEMSSSQRHHTTKRTNDSDSETESVTMRKEKMFSSTQSSRSTATRSFLNSSGESKVVTSVDDVLERMRNADNVVEDGDTAEDQEARALLNKFLGASVLMKGVESVLPPTKQTRKIITTSTYANNDKDPFDACGDQMQNQEVKTTRITKTIKSGSSSSPVTRTTCDIEEIWDEEILKSLLEQATTYEERRKIRARLRELMAEREEKNKSKAGIKAEPLKESAQKAADDAEQCDSSSSSEYEEIIEEVTDYSETDEDDANDKDHDKDKTKTTTKDNSVQKPSESVEEKSQEVVEKSSEKVDRVVTVEEVTQSVEDTTIVEKSSTDSAKKETESEAATQKGESLIPLLQDILHKNMPQPAAATNKKSTKPHIATSSSTKIKQSKVAATSAKASGDSVVVNCSSKTSSNTNSSCSSSSMITVNNTHSHTSSSNSQPASEQTSKRLTTSQVVAQPTPNPNRLSVPPKEDSGTESGEDLRLIAAGLRDHLQNQSGSADSSLIQEVTAALSRLESSLKEGSSEISVDQSRRQALLALVARLQTGLTSPEKLAELNEAMSSHLEGGSGDLDGQNFEETSSPEADAHRSNRQRFAKRRNRNCRHTVGVSREELADARRYMEDMIMMDSISNSTTPESNATTPPQWIPIEKNASSGAIVSQPAAPPVQPTAVLYRPKQFVPENLKTSTECLNGSGLEENKPKRPLSGNYAVSFSEEEREYKPESEQRTARQPTPADNRQPSPADAPMKSATRFSASKRYLMKRANTIDIPKTKKYNPDFDTDSEMDERGTLGLKRTVQVNVRQKVRNVIPPFEPKTDNDHKFLAFINKQSAKPGLGWGGARSVSNWTNKFGNIKHTFEVGAAATATTGKPPMAPGHGPQNAAKNYWSKQVGQSPDYNASTHYASGAQRSHQEQRRLERERAERERMERQRLERQKQERERTERDRMEMQRMERERIERDRLERQRLERERIERDRLERQYQERERMERDRLELLQRQEMERHEMQRLEREHLERQRMEKEGERLQREYYERERLQQQREAAAQVVKPVPVNQFIHAPQSVFRPIENEPPSSMFNPIPGVAGKGNTWQPPSNGRPKPTSLLQSPNSGSPQYGGKQKAPDSYITTPSPNSSPIGLPWASKPTLNNRDFKSKAHKFEERSQNDMRQQQQQQQPPYLQRHNSLRSQKASGYSPQQQQQFDDYKKRPSLPNATDPYMAQHSQYMPQQEYLSRDMYHQAAPPPVNYSFTYADYTPKATNYQSYPCLPTAVENHDYPARSRDDSLTNPDAVPLVLTSSNPQYSPQTESFPSVSMSSMQPPPRTFNYVSPADSGPPSPSVMTMPATDCTDDDLDSDNMLEYRVESKVMRKPQCQTAVTVGRRTAHMSDDEVFGKNSRNAKNLLSTMKSIGNANGGAPKKLTKKPNEPPSCLSPDGRSYQAPIVEPIFPQVTNFEPNRNPMFVQAPPQPAMQQYHIPPYKQKPPQPAPMAPPPQANSYHREEYAKTSSYQHSSNGTPYLSETQTAYVVTYPDDGSETHEQPPYQKPQPPNTLQLQRSRNVSENSTASSQMSYNNLPSPGTNWTANPMHSDDTPVVVMRKKSYPRAENVMTSSDPYNYQHRQAQPMQQPPMQQPPMQQQPMQQQPIQQQPMQQQPTSQQQQPTPQQQQFVQSPPQPQTQGYPDQGKPQASAKPRIASQPTHVTSPQQSQPPQTYRKPTVPTQQAQLTNRTQTITQQSQQTHQTLERRFASQLSLPRQQTIDNGQIPLQNEFRVMSQQSLAITKQQQQYDEKSVQQQQQQLKQQQITEIRRKSLGNIIDIQQQQRRSAYFETTQQHQKEILTKEEQYKSSAPPDTPDIVKSSLPKDENQPILKKFGPPQRHHYMPNSYQNPLQSQAGSGSASKKVTTETHLIKSMQQQTLTTTTTAVGSKKPEIVETPATPQPEDLIPRNIVFNNVSAFTSMSRHTHNKDERPANEQPRPNRLSKCDSWNQIVQLQQQQQHQQTPQSPKFNQSPVAGGNELRRTKSGHSLAVPKMFEAGMDRTEITEKQKTVAAYFSGHKSPNAAAVDEQQQQQFMSSRKTTINRTKTSEKVSASRKSLNAAVSGAPASFGGGLARSATMPHIANVSLLDESNVEDAFEQLMMGS